MIQEIPLSRVLVNMKHPFATCLLLVLCSASVFGLGGKLEAPSLAYRSDLDEDFKTEDTELMPFGNGVVSLRWPGLGRFTGSIGICTFSRRECLLSSVDV